MLDTSNIERATAFPSFLHAQSKQSCLATKTLALIFALEFSFNLSSGGTSAGGSCLCQNGNWMRSGVQTADHMYVYSVVQLGANPFYQTHQSQICILIVEY